MRFRHAISSTDSGSFNDPRLSDRPTPYALGARTTSRSSSTTMTTTSSATAPRTRRPPQCLPDHHFFRGPTVRKDIFPLYRDAAGTSPNLLCCWSSSSAWRLGRQAETLLAYTLRAGWHRLHRALPRGARRAPLAHPCSAHLRPGLFERMVTASARGSSGCRPSASASARPSCTTPGAEAVAVTEPPGIVRLRRWSDELIVGNGRVGPVSHRRLQLRVSSFEVLQNWLGNRRRKDVGAPPAPSTRSATKSGVHRRAPARDPILQHTVDVTPQARRS